MKLSFMILIAVFLVACADRTVTINKEPGADVLSASVIKAHMAFLADDLLEGREVGTRGEEISGLYIASEFESIGLDPGGNDGSYFQNVPLIAATVDMDRTVLEVELEGRRLSFENGVDIAMFGSSEETVTEVSGELVFVGHGVSAPELGIDDYKGMEVAGKVVVVLGGELSFLPSAEAAHLGTTAEKRKTAFSHGAIGMIAIRTPADEERFPFKQIRPFLERPSLELQTPETAASKDGQQVPALLANLKTGDALFAGSSIELDVIIAKGETGPVPGMDLEASVTLKRVTQHKDDIQSANIAGLLTGSDPGLSKEYVVVTAHYDHIGICRPEGVADRICNGALDNALGVAAMLDVARRLSQASTRPARSVLFLAVGAEEEGLLGSSYFAEYPTVPADAIIANINMDGGFPFYQFSDVIAFGAEHSELGDILADAIAPLGLTVAPDPFPEENIFTRSDQYSFVKKGVPALFLYNGFTDVNGENAGLPIWNGSLGENYHAPTDDLSLPIDYDVAAKYADVFHRLVFAVAKVPTRPLWYEDSLFGQRFAPDAPKASRPDLQ